MNLSNKEERRRFISIIAGSALKKRAGTIVLVIDATKGTTFVLVMPYASMAAFEHDARLNGDLYAIETVRAARVPGLLCVYLMTPTGSGVSVLAYPTREK